MKKRKKKPLRVVADPKSTPEIAPGEPQLEALANERASEEYDGVAAATVTAMEPVQIAPPSNGNGHAPYLDEPSDLAALLPGQR